MCSEIIEQFQPVGPFFSADSETEYSRIGLEFSNITECNAVVVMPILLILNFLIV
jgi:hypothetical protein